MQISVQKGKGIIIIIRKQKQKQNTKKKKKQNKTKQNKTNNTLISYYFITPQIDDLYLILVTYQSLDVPVTVMANQMVDSKMKQ